MKKIYVLLTVTSLFLGCNQKKKNPTLDEAYEVHKSVIDTQKEVILQWAKLDELVKSDTIVINNKANYETWKHDLLEVPGYPHIHIEGDDHKHHHHEQINLPDEKNLDVQKELKKRIDEIHLINQRIIDTLKI